MCDGDFGAALELAIGPARVPGGTPQPTIEERMEEVLGDYEPTQKELDEIGREMDERDGRIRVHPLAESSMDYAVATHRWLQARQTRPGDADPVVRESVDIIAWDSHLIHVKIMRALNGRDEHPSGAWCDASAVQTDWNGSAKVALLSINRSEAAWRAVAKAVGDDAAAMLADTLRRLSRTMDEEFPRAKDFRRPGFDDDQQMRGGRLEP
jgi:hypothetical protein